MHPRPELTHAAMRAYIKRRHEQIYREQNALDGVRLKEGPNGLNAARAKLNARLAELELLRSFLEDGY